MNRTPSVQLEPAAEQVVATAGKPPLIFRLPPEQGRCILEQMQDAPVYKHPAAVRSLAVDTGPWGSVRVYTVTPQNATSPLGAILYLHGGGWVFGSLHTHDKLVRELAVRTNSVVIFPEYTRSPEVKFPTALEQCYGVLTALPRILGRLEYTVDLARLTIAGDSVGGNMATVLAMLAKERSGPKIHKQLLFYPVTNAAFDTRSYRRFARGYYLYRAGMMWFWDQYTKSAKARATAAASPLRATMQELKDLPQTLIINGEADVLRDEGEAYAKRLRQAGVEVCQARFQATIHDFVMLNALDQTAATRGAMDLATAWVNEKNRM